MISKIFNGVTIELIQQNGGCSPIDFLQRLLPIPISSLKKQTFTPTAFLNGRAKIMTVFYLFKKDSNHIQLWVDLEYKQDTINYLESMRFAEDDPQVHIQPTQWIEIRSEDSFQSPVKTYPLPDWQIHNKSIQGWLVEAKDELAFSKGQFKEPIEREIFNILSYQAKSPSMDFALFRDLMILDGPFDHFLSRDSGCYPGQEVVEKIYSIGRRPKEMACCQIHAPHLDTPENLFFEGKKIGRLLSVIPIQREHLHKMLDRLSCVSDILEQIEDQPICQGLAVLRSLPNIPQEVFTERDGFKVKMIS